MRRYTFDSFGLEHLRLVDVDPPAPGPGEVRVRVEAASLNFRDSMIVRGLYNPRLKLPATPLSDGAGVVEAVGDGVTSCAVGDAVLGHFIPGWIDGPYRGDYLGTTLGTPGPGLAAESVVLPADAVVARPAGMTAAEAATLPIAALTAWSAVVTEGAIQRGQTVLTLGTGGVSIFALQIAKAKGARVVITSSSDEKLERARALGADVTINYRTDERWERAVLDATDGGADVVVENGGVGTLTQSLRAVRPGGVVALLGALTGLKGEVDIAPLVMKRVRVAGTLVDSRASLEAMIAFLSEHDIRPVISDRFPFERLRDALEHLGRGGHFGKIVVEY